MLDAHRAIRDAGSTGPGNDQPGKEKHMKLLWTLFAALLLSSSLMILPACETTEGFGRDVENAGEEISEGADEIEDEIED
jgi:predicted small secreted protein